jgi:hypothetical protein
MDIRKRNREGERETVALVCISSSDDNIRIKAFSTLKTNAYVG